MRTHSIEGGGGLKLHVRDFGPLDAPSILLIHGWSQHHLCWSKQIESPLAAEFRLVAMDLRGHGQSDAPLNLASYTSGPLWADDIAAVIENLELRSPILVGWSYGGFVIGDYLRVHGDAAIVGVNLVSGAVGIGPRWFGPLIGADFFEYAPLAASEDPAVALKAMQSLLHRMAIRDLPAPDVELALGGSMLTPAAVRGYLIRRDEDYLPEYEALSKPLLVTYGAADTIVLPAMAELIRERCPTAQMSEYADTGHVPFLEDPERFNRELGDFARSSRKLSPARRSGCSAP
jgi:pimeloyl-ACP methyl ester carboxylesterase